MPVFTGAGFNGKANLFGFEMIAGFTVALGGVKGTGRTYVEVLSAEKANSAPPPPKKAAPRPGIPAKSPRR